MQPEYPFDGLYAALCQTLPGWSVDLNGDAIDLWNREGDPLHTSAMVYTDGIGGWLTNVGPRRFESSPHEYDGMVRAEVDAILVDVLAAIDRAVAETKQRAAVVIPESGSLPPLY